MPIELFHWLSIVLLALLLFFPTSTIIWVLSVRHLQKKRGQPLSAAETQGQRSRARFIAVLIALPFAYLFYVNVILSLHE